MNNPLEQFTIINFFKLRSYYWDFTLNTNTIYLILNSFFILAFLAFIWKNNFIQNKAFYFFNLVSYFFYLQIKNILYLYNSKFIPFISILFIYILILNLVGLIPYSWTSTSQIILTLSWSTTIIFSVTLIGILKHGFKFIYLFLPKGIPNWILPFIFLIEIISYSSRILSLAIRLSTNIISGHILLNLFTSFNFILLSSFNFISLFIIPIISVFFILEIGISIIQAYVFSFLTACYIRDSVLLH